MSSFIVRRRRHYLSVIFCIVLTVALVSGQTKREKQDQAEDVVRINTELVQTGVTVLDKQGHFVDGLQRE